MKIIQHTHLFLVVISTLFGGYAVSNQDSFDIRMQELALYKQFDIRADISSKWQDELNDSLATYNYPTDFISVGTTYLLEAYPKLKEQLPYLGFANLPTPITQLTHIMTEYGTQVYMKNDALTGGYDDQGNHIYGGNKVRKLEFLLAHAKSLGATKIVTFGCVASNHAVATTVHAHRQGFAKVIVMLCHQPPSRAVQHNLLLHQAYGSQLHYYANNDIRKIETVALWLDHLKKDGQVPYMIPTGGSNAIGALGYVNAVFELVEQIQRGAMPAPTHIYVPIGSCATTAGILLGCKATGLKAAVVAIAVMPMDELYFEQGVEQLFKQTHDLLRRNDDSFPECTYSSDDLCIDQNFSGPKYGIFTPEGVHAARKILAAQAVSLDGTYSAKCFAGLLSHIQHNPAQVALFWNTYCGLDFSHVLNGQSYKQLPHCLHDYFDDANLQEFDR